MKLITIFITLFVGVLPISDHLDNDNFNNKKNVLEFEKSNSLRKIINDTMQVPRIIINNNCYDFDVLLPGNNGPSFRLLLPEHILTNSFTINNVHTYPATWNKMDDGVKGIINFEQGLKCSLMLKSEGDFIFIKLSLVNLSQNTLNNVQINVCAGVNHLPNTVQGSKDWSNKSFIPENISLDRTIQGNYWYTMVTPAGLKAWTTNNDWIVMHAFPDNPVPDPDDLYKTFVSKITNSVGCAAISTNKRKLFYMIWNTKYSQFQSPYAGSACMHLLPLVAKELRPQEEMAIEGKVGIYSGTWNELGRGLMNFIKNE